MKVQREFVRGYLNGPQILGNYSFVPLDLPKIELPAGATLKFLKERSFTSSVLESFPDHEAFRDIGAWKEQYSMRLVSLPNYYDRQNNPRAFVGNNYDTFADALDPDLPWDWTADAKTHFTQLISWIERYLPFSKITDVPMVRSAENLHAHLDQAYPAIRDHHRLSWEQSHHPYEPAHYRIIFDGSIEGSTFLTDRFSKTSEKTFLSMPEDTNSFCLGATNCFHGSAKGDVKTLVCVFGQLDLKRHAELIQRSVEKYKNFCKKLELSDS